MKFQTESLCGASAASEIAPCDVVNPGGTQWVFLHDRAVASTLGSSLLTLRGGGYMWPMSMHASKWWPEPAVLAILWG